MMNDGGAKIILLRAKRMKILTTPIPESNHAHFCIIEATETGKQAFLDRRRSSKSSRVYCVASYS